MFTYKFVGLSNKDAQTAFYYGSLRAKPELGQVLLFEETGNRYLIVLIVGKGLEGDGPTNQEKLAFAEIVRGDPVPTLALRKVVRGEAVPPLALKKGDKQLLQKSDLQDVIRPTGRSFDPDEIKESSRRNRKLRLAKPSSKK
jgi:hypothetical protein